jgi:hypothetical protein
VREVARVLVGDAEPQVATRRARLELSEQLVHVDDADVQPGVLQV